MYFKLLDQYLLRGWERLPFALKNKETGKVSFFDKESYLVLIKCNGKENIYPELLSIPEKKILEKFQKQELIKPSTKRMALSHEQEYIKYPTRYIQSVHWSITGKCNYNCRHCFMSASTNKLGELSTTECKKIIDEFVSCGITNISLTGGEPLFRKDFFELLDYMLENGMIIDSIYSNGKLITKKFLESLRKRNITPSITMSFDGIGFHDWLRGVSGAQENVIEAFKICKDYGFKTNAAMCLHQKNKDTIHATILLLKKLGVSRLKISRASSTGEWEKEIEANKLTLEETYNIYLNYLPKYYEDGLPVPLQLENFYASLENPKKYAIPGEKFSGDFSCLNKAVCGHIRKNLYIDPEGYILPCMPMASTEITHDFPNILETPLSDILNQSLYMDRINVRLKDLLENNQKCRECEYVLKCGGGCRGLALGEFNQNNNYFQEDPSSCVFFKNNYPEKIRVIINELIEKYIN